MLKIGDFSVLAQVSIRTLRFYDESGLLRPARIDEESGYRYYSVRQLAQLHRILALRDFGFSLDQIGQMLRQGVTAEQMRGMLLLQQSEQEKRVQEEGDRLSRISSRIRLIEREKDMAYDVILKTVPKQTFASTRETIAAYNAVGALYGKVASALGPAMSSVALSVAIWHDREFREKDVDAEAGFYLKPGAVPGSLPPGSGVAVREVPETTAACVVHNGAFRQLREAYAALLQWVGANGYEMAGPIRELYLHYSQPVRQDDESYVTEVQAPVRKAAAAAI